MHVERVYAGEVPLTAAEAHHARAVLRLGDGTAVEVFDDAGRVGRGVLRAPAASSSASVVVGEVSEAATGAFQFTVASAVPKGPRADWMIEKLSELGAGAFIPLKAARSVVVPEGRGKRERWERLAAEASKQSRRRGVMRIEPLAEPLQLAASIGASGWYFSTAAGVVPVARAVAGWGDALVDGAGGALTLLIGPEGGWTEGEVAGFGQSGLTAVGLTDTILRIETAAVAAASIVAAFLARDAAGD